MLICTPSSRWLETPPSSRVISKTPQYFFFCVLFIAYWFFMLAIAVVAFAYGDGRRLIFATDYRGNTCGRNGLGASVYYPQEFLYNELYSMAPTKEVSVNDINMAGICVSACPEVGDFVCKYDAQQNLSTMFSTQAEIDGYLTSCLEASQADNQGVLNLFGMRSRNISNLCQRFLQDCWFVVEPQVNVFFRCVANPLLSQYTSYSCAYPKYQDALNRTLKMPARVCSDQKSIVHPKHSSMSHAILMFVVRDPQEQRARLTTCAGYSNRSIQPIASHRQATGFCLINFRRGR